MTRSASGTPGLATRATVLVLNGAAHTEQLQRVAADLAVDIRHLEFWLPWEEIAARRAGRVTGAGAAPAEMRSACADADVIFGFFLPPRLTDFAPRLRWIETPSAGSDHLLGTGVLEGDVIVTTAASALAPLVAEHAFALLLALCRALPQAVHAQANAEWRKTPVRELQGATMAIIGLGRIGQAVARAAKAFGMRVLATRRRMGACPAYVDRVVPIAELGWMLSEADVVVVAVPGTRETAKLIGEAELAAMKPGAYLINVARGIVLDESALIRALGAGRLAGAGLDVFVAEPLPPSSPLWHAPNVIITPHAAVDVASRLPRAVAHFSDNLARYLSGEPLCDQFDRARGY